MIKNLPQVLDGCHAIRVAEKKVEKGIKVDIINKMLSLTPLQKELIYSICENGSEIIDAEYFRDEYLPAIRISYTDSLSILYMTFAH